MDLLLLHGGWQGGWCWDGVAAELRSRGHAVLTPTLPGLDAGAYDRSGIGLSTLVRFAADQVLADDLRDLVVVGHSGGGSVAQGLAERLQERIGMLVFMSARVLQHGESILSLGGSERRDAYLALSACTPDGAVPLSEETWLRLCSDLPPEQARAWLPRLSPTPIGWLQEPADMPTEAWRHVPCAFVFLEGEPAAARALYSRMAARLPNPRVTHCPGAHEAMLSQPRAVAEAILRIAA